MERFTLFWTGPFSQWEPAWFTLDGVEYSCAEQYMMAEKARLFADLDTLELIMQSESPATHKALGRVVDGFEVHVWQEEEDNGMPRCWNIVWRGNMAKFSQNPHLLEALLATRGTSMVEASPVDRIWGIGLDAKDPAARDRASWRGRNWLGEVLDDVRDRLAAGERLGEAREDAGDRA